MYTRIDDKEKLNRDLWIEVNLDAIAHNMRVIRSLSKSTMISAVVKADGYGHGAVAVGRTLLENGADRFAVATADEAYELRDEFPDTPVLILGEVDIHLAPALAEKKIAVTVTSPEKLTGFYKQLQTSASTFDSPLVVHIKVDTGMGRIGCEPTEEAANAWKKAVESVGDSVVIEGVFSHFAKADDSDKAFSHFQAKLFIDFVEMLAARGIHPPVKHMANSAAVLELPEYHFDMVRAGILLFGMTPTGESLHDCLKRRAPDMSVNRLADRDVNVNRGVNRDADLSRVPELIPALSIKSRVIFVKNVFADMGIGYSHSFVAKKGSTIVTVPAGYADGISRLLSNKMDVLIGGRRCRQVGNVCMDHFMVLGYEGVKVGDEIVIAGCQRREDGVGANEDTPAFGEYGGAAGENVSKFAGNSCYPLMSRISVEELAEKMGTLNYEIICMLSKRIPRVYIHDGAECR